MAQLAFAPLGQCYSAVSARRASFRKADFSRARARTLVSFFASFLSPRSTLLIIWHHVISPGQCLREQRQRSYFGIHSVFSRTRCRVHWEKEMVNPIESLFGFKEILRKKFFLDAGERNSVDYDICLTVWGSKDFFKSDIFFCQRASALGDTWRINVRDVHEYIIELHVEMYGKMQRIGATRSQLL